MIQQQRIDAAVQEVLQAGEMVQWSAPASMMTRLHTMITVSSLGFDVLVIGVLWWFQIMRPWLWLIGAGLIGMTIFTALLRSKFGLSQSAGRYVITDRRILEVTKGSLGIQGFVIMPADIETVQILAGKTPTSGTLKIQASRHTLLTNPHAPLGQTTRTWPNIENVQAVQMQLEALRSNPARSLF